VGDHQRIPAVVCFLFCFDFLVPTYRAGVIDSTTRQVRFERGFLFAGKESLLCIDRTSLAFVKRVALHGELGARASSGRAGPKGDTTGHATGHITRSGACSLLS
jgi:hypothetical protein